MYEYYFRGNGEKGWFGNQVGGIDGTVNVRTTP